MADKSIYETIAKRTGGDIYIGVVGPVRTGKSTLIHKFMESTVIPNLENEYDRARSIDELPQSGSGKTITTTEPKFIPAEAVSVRIGEAKMKLRMIDCVGYMVNGAIGEREDENERMVMTPWSEEPLPFSKAGEIGTERVVREHSTIALLVSCDGSICDIPRDSYIAAEERLVKELREVNKPFAIVLNSKYPASEEAITLAHSLEEKYSAPVALLNCTEINSSDVGEILSLILREFPMRQLKFTLPEWFSMLPKDCDIRREILDGIHTLADSVTHLSDTERLINMESGKFKLIELDAATGSAVIDIPVSREKFYSVLSSLTDLKIDSDTALISALSELAADKADYDKVRSALADVRERGYGIVMPEQDSIRIGEPELSRQGSSYGIRVGASADTVHMIRANINADVCPVIGSEEQSLEVIKLMKEDFMLDPKRLLETNVLGRSLLDLVYDGMNSKLAHINTESQGKLANALERIVNEGANGLICILV